MGNLIDTAKYDELVKAHVMFKDMDADPYLKSAGIASDWPYGRGCWQSTDGQCIIWFGEEDQLRIMCMKKGTMLNEVFDRLNKMLQVVEAIEGIEFAHSENYGYVTSCPSNLGTGMRASVHVKIPNLTSDGTDTKAKEIAGPLGLSVRGTGGEHTPIGADGTVDISPQARLFIKECEIIEKLYKGIELLMEQEKAAGGAAPAPAAEAPAEAAPTGARGSDGPVDISGLTRIAKDDLGLMPQPVEPKFKIAMVQVYDRTVRFGGSDKSSNGHRHDTIPIANGMINAGMSCQLIHYVHEDHDKFFETLKSFDATIVRCNQGQIAADGGDQKKFDDGMRELRNSGKQMWMSPDAFEALGTKDALVKLSALNMGLEDTAAYGTTEDFAAGLKKTLAFQPRVIKQRNGSAGDGVWVVKLKEGNYGAELGERECGDDEVLALVEAKDGHEEEKTVAEFVEMCGKYLGEGGGVVDQRFCPRIAEGEVRLSCIGDQLMGVVHRKPAEGGVSAVGGTGSTFEFFGPDEEKFKAISAKFFEELPQVMPAMGFTDEPLPLWWNADLILASAEGTAPEEEKWIVGDINCACVGISQCLPAYCKDDTPNASYNDIPKNDKGEAQRMGDLMGVKALAVLEKDLHV